METIHHALMPISEVIDLIGLAIVLIGATKFVVMYTIIELRRLVQRQCAAEIHRARLLLGTYIVVALEFMICSDIINSVAVRTLESLLYLAGVVVLRTAISFFLERELERDASPQLPTPSAKEEHV